MSDIMEETAQTDEVTSSVRAGFEEIAAKVAAGTKLDDDELDKVADVALVIIRNLLSYFDATNVTIDEYDGERGQLIFNVVGDDLGTVEHVGLFGY